MAEAEVGDEQHFADPTVNVLCERVAELLGFEAAVFLPSGTMCNAIGFRLHIRPGGDEAYLHRISHPIKAEAGGPAALSGAVLCPLEGERGMFDAATLAAAMRPPGRPLPPALAARLRRADHEPRRRPRVAARAAARGRRGGQGQRAAAAHGRRAADERRRRQRRADDRVDAGLRHRVDRLLQGPRRADGRRARRLAGADRRGLALQADDGRRAAPGRASSRRARCGRSTTTSSGSRRTTSTPACSPRGWPGCPASRSTRPTVATNIVVFRVDDAPALCTQLAAAGVIMGALDDRTVRAVTHLDVGAEGIATALEALGAALAPA